MTQDFEQPELSKPRENQETSIISDDSVPPVEAVEAQSRQEPASPLDDFPFPPIDARPVDTRLDELRELNLAIEIYPEAAINYAARGDYFRRKGDRALALDDYRHALALAEAEITQGNWALVAQALQDEVLHTLSEMGVA